MRLSRFAASAAMRHAAKTLGMALIAIVLTGCFVVSEAPVEGEGSTMDPGLIGVWRGLDDEGKYEPGHVLHVYQAKREAALEMVWIQKDTYAGMDVSTTTLGGKRFMNVTFHQREEAMTGSDKELFSGTVIVLYEVRGRDLWIALMNDKAWGEAIEAGRIKGRFSSDNKTTRSVRVTASARDLTDFVAKNGTETLFNPLKPAFRRATIQ